MFELFACIRAMTNYMVAQKKNTGRIDVGRTGGRVITEVAILGHVETEMRIQLADCPGRQRLTFRRIRLTRYRTTAHDETTVLGHAVIEGFGTHITRAFLL